MACKIIRLTCILFFLNFLNIEVGNAQKYTYETPNMPGKFTRKEAQMAQLLLHNAADIALNRVFGQSNTSMNTSECIKQLVNSTGQAFSYFDASGKLPAGFGRGDVTWLGSFDTCLGIPNAHYCLLRFDVKFFQTQFQNKTLPFTLAVCLPSACGPDDFHEWFANISTLHKHVHQFRVDYKGAECPERPEYTTGVVATLFLCGFLLLLCLLGTIVDVFEWQSCSFGIFDRFSPTHFHPTRFPRESSSINHDQVSGMRDEEVSFQASLQPYNKNTTDMSAPLVSDSTPPRQSAISAVSEFLFDILRCFSLVRNTTKIFSTTVPPKVITSINGMRVISMFWIILGHTFLFMLYSSLVANPIDLFSDTKKFSMMAVVNGFFSVDTFFFLSGLLVAYTCLRKLEKNEGRFNWLLFYFHRYMRLTPPLMFMILFYTKLYPFLSYSPLWTLQKDELCPRYWWTNLLYINNFYPVSFNDECVGWTWYLANDMQFFIISPLVLILAHRYGRLGLLASAGSLFMMSTIILASIYGHYDIDPLALSKWNAASAFDTSKRDFSKMVYDKPYCRIQPYLIGITLGYFIHKSYSGTRKPTWIVAVIAWLGAIALGISLVYGPYDNIKKDARPWSKAEKLFYGTFSRAAWGVALAWVVYACHFGFGGLIQRFLSARFWIPLSRLTYSAYLVHPIVLTFLFKSSNTTLYYTTKTVTYSFITAVVIAYACAFVLAVVIEFPCDNLENLAINSVGKKKQSNQA